MLEKTIDYPIVIDAVTAEIASADLLALAASTVGGELSGTSMATAVTAGVVAQMIHAHTVSTTWEGQLTPHAIKAWLQYSAVPLAGVDVLTQGAGTLNGDGAVALAASSDSRRPVDQWWLTQGVSERSESSGESFEWGQRFIWGDRQVWGDRDDGTAGARVVLP